MSEIDPCSDCSRIDMLVLCGGLGSRLKSVVGDRQKCAAEIAGLPFYSHVIRHAFSFGFRRFVLCAGFMSDSVSGSAEGLPLEAEMLVIVEDRPLGTGGAVKNALRHVHGGLFVVANGDSFCPADLGGLVRAHLDNNAMVTMLLAEAGDRADAGNVGLAPDGQVRSFSEKGTPPASGRFLVNAGVYVFSKEAASFFPEKESFSLERDFFPNMVGRRFYGHPTGLPLLDIGTPERFMGAEGFIKKHL